MKLPSEYETGRPLHRALAVEDVVIGDTDEDGATVVEARLVPYGKRVEIGPGVEEEFRPGAFSRASNAPGRVKFRGIGVGDGHQDAPVIGHAVQIRDEASGPVGRFTIPPTTVAQDTLTLMRHGTLDEVSIEFATVKDGYTVEQRAGGIRLTHSRSRLLAVVPVPVGAYGRDALVTMVRSEMAAEQQAAIEKLRRLRS